MTQGRSRRRIVGHLPGPDENQAVTVDSAHLATKRPLAQDWIGFPSNDGSELALKFLSQQQQQQPLLTVARKNESAKLYTRPATLPPVMTSPDRDADSSSDAPIPSGSLRSRRSELDTDLHSASSHSRRRRLTAGTGGDLPQRPLTKSLHSGQREQRRKEHAQRHLAKGIAQYDDTDCESCGDDEDDEVGDNDYRSTYDDEDDDDDDCSSFCEPTDSCVANNRYLCRGMSIEICELHDVSEFDDQVAEPLEAVESLSLM